MSFLRKGDFFVFMPFLFLPSVTHNTETLLLSFVHPYTTLSSLLPSSYALRMYRGPCPRALKTGNVESRRESPFPLNILQRSSQRREEDLLSSQRIQH